MCHYWKDANGYTSLTKRTCYRCGYIRPILNLATRGQNQTILDSTRQLNLHSYLNQNQVFHRYNLFDGNDNWFRAIIPRNSFLGNCYEHGFF